MAWKDTPGAVKETFWIALFVGLTLIVIVIVIGVVAAHLFPA
jgi:hypothetical protein